MGILKDPNDIVGKRYGKLCVTKYAGTKSVKGESCSRSHYLCKCDCGKDTLVSRKMLKAGKRTSCGDCTKILDRGEWCEYICENGGSFIFDKEDLSIVSARRWHLNQNGYPITIIKQKGIFLCRLLLGIKDGYFVDHINGIRSDCRRKNLRVASINDNNHNLSLPAHNSSGYKGVSFYSPRGKYRAYIKNCGRRKHLGYYDTPEKAARAYDEAARFYFGEFACVNFPREGEQCCRRNVS